MTAGDIRKRFLSFFAKRKHAILASASLVTPDEKGVTNATLFNTAGVQPIVPYILQGNHPAGQRLASAQKCIRTIDIDEVGDNTHLTFFEMLGNWSLGDYFKAEAIQWSYEFLTDKKEGLGLDPARLYVTVFAGDENAPKDITAFEEWKKYIPEHRIYFKGADSNWWPAVKSSVPDTWTGPTGPCTEMFYDVTGTLGDITPMGFEQADAEQKIVEIWNDVFMQFNKVNGVITETLSKYAVDTGAGLERLVTVINNHASVYETDVFAPILSKIKSGAQQYTEISGRIIADHIKAAALLITDGVTPSNTDRGYVLRRLIRRAVRRADKIGFSTATFSDLVTIIASIYTDVYTIDVVKVTTVIGDEESKFRKTLDDGIRMFKKMYTRTAEKVVSAQDAFMYYSTFGFPIDLIEEEAADMGLSVDTKGFEEQRAQHQQKSRQGAEQKFKGGLANTGEQEVKYHTATHLLHQALRDVLGATVSQKGSNITAERMRFDFTTPEKLTPDQKKRVEDIVNEKIQAALPVHHVVLPRADAEKTGALHFFGDKYGESVTVYFIGDTLENAYSKEFCGGPHVHNTKELGHFSIQKEEAVAAGIRRIKAILD